MVRSLTQRCATLTILSVQKHRQANVNTGGACNINNDAHARIVCFCKFGHNRGTKFGGVLSDSHRYYRKLYLPIPAYQRHRKARYSVALLFVVLASRDLVSQAFGYRYSHGLPGQVILSGDQNLGVEADAGYCFNPSPTIYKNAFQLCIGLDEDKAAKRSAPTDGKGYWIPSAAVYTDIFFTQWPYTLNTISGGGISTYSVAVSKSGVVVINEGGSLT